MRCVPNGRCRGPRPPRLGAGLLAALLAAATGAAEPPAVIVAEVRLADFVDRVEALGTLRANESVEITSAVTETVSAVHFDDGDRVAAGQVLVEMTSAEEHALLEEARATKEEALIQYDRVKSLANQGTAARSLLDERRREGETARARLSAIESRLADRLVRAPFAGVVGLRNISPGALVEPGDRITTLDDDRVMKLDFAVPSTFLDALRPGLEIVAEARAYGDREFRGEVRSVDSRVDPITRSVVVRAMLPNADRALRPGMLMQVELLKNPRRALVIPEEALMPLGRDQAVLLVSGEGRDKVERRDIRIGARRPGEVEVLEGLTPGDLVITHGGLKLRPGQKVRVQLTDDGSQPLPAMLRAVGGTGP
jgi:membrane fusion protein (multidrug efflux system)